MSGEFWLNLVISVAIVLGFFVIVGIIVNALIDAWYKREVDKLRIGAPLCLQRYWDEEDKNRKWWR
jgi:hypothetical protein